MPDDRDAEEAHQGNWEAASGKRRNKKKRGGPEEADAMSDVDAEVVEALKTKQRLCPEATNVSASWETGKFQDHFEVILTILEGNAVLLNHHTSM